MTPRRQDSAARRRDELNRERGSIAGALPAIDAQQRLSDRRADGTRPKPGAVGLSDPRYAYLTRSHD